jgi:imidazolonepropionase-like amidohydrolase
VRELELLVEAGLTPADALQAGTVDAAELMKLDDGGTVESGKRADLIVLAANPLDDISNLRTVRWVVVDGKVYEAAKLWALAGFGN